MSKDKPSSHRIKAPKPNRKADFARAAMRGATGAIPVAGAPIAEAVNLAMPDPTAKDRKRWEVEITDEVNSLHISVDALERNTGEHQQEPLTEATISVAKLIAENCPDGLADHIVPLADILSACPDLSEGEILDALGDIEARGWIVSISFMNSPPCYRMAECGYEFIDPLIMGWNTEEDARELAKLAIAEVEGVLTNDLDEALGWPKRRFNPALRIVVSFVEPGRVSQATGDDYVTWSFSPNDADRARLRRFIAEEE